MPPAYANLFTLGAALGLFAGANAILHETGIVTVVAGGLTLALASELAVIVGAAVLLVRPLNLAVSTGPGLLPPRAGLPGVDGGGEARADAARRWGARLGADRVFSWRGGLGAGVRPVWEALPDPGTVEAEVEAGRVAFGVVDVGPEVEAGRFGEDLLPLFWVANVGQRRAELVRAPRAVVAGGPDADAGAGGLAVVLRRPVRGLHGLVRDVVLMGERGLGLADVVPALLEVAAQDLGVAGQGGAAAQSRRVRRARAAVARDSAAAAANRAGPPLR